VVTVTRIDRLARSTFDLFAIVKRIADVKAQFRSLAEPSADTGTGRLMLAVLGGIADVERDLIRTRTAEGKSRAKARGKHMGRPPALTPADTGTAERGHQTARRRRYVAGIGRQLRPQHFHDAPRHASRLTTNGCVFRQNRRQDRRTRCVGSPLIPPILTRRSVFTNYLS
jgi:hypothetical protein